MAAVETKITLNLPVREVCECNMLEEEKGKICKYLEDTLSLHLAFRAFEIKTLRLCR